MVIYIYILDNKVSIYEIWVVFIVDFITFELFRVIEIQNRKIFNRVSNLANFAMKSENKNKNMKENDFSLIFDY